MLVLGYGVIYERVYILIDPILYVPWILILIIVFYGLLIRYLSNDLQQRLAKPN